MYLLFLAAFTLVYNLFFKEYGKTALLKAVPAYVNKKRIPKNHKVPLPKDIPTFYY